MVTAGQLQAYSCESEMTDLKEVVGGLLDPLPPSPTFPRWPPLVDAGIKRD
jgi:hypothetical protein